MRATAIVTPLAFSQKFSGRGNLPPGATGALAAFDDLRNGFAAAQTDHVADAARVNKRETPQRGFGPLHNADSCGSCHFNPVTEAISELSEFHARQRDENGLFADAAGDSLINSDALAGAPLPYVPDREKMPTFRFTLNVLGDGYVEAIAGETREEIARSQADSSGGRLAGQGIRAPLLEAPGQTRAARFDWENQHASLISFFADDIRGRWGLRLNRHNISRRGKVK